MVLCFWVPRHKGSKVEALPYFCVPMIKGHSPSKIMETEIFHHAKI
jgi:hypothetical protein